MANVPKAITDLPVASAMGDDDLLVVSQNATTSSIKGELIKSYAQNAVASQVTAAQTAATQAANSATNAESARQGAEDAQEAAESAQTSAEQAATEATNAAGTIGGSVEQAKGYATQAGSARDAAISAQQAAETAEDNAVSAKTAAETAQTAAEGSATQAAGSATTAQSAATQAGEAKDDAVTAQGQAETAANTATSAATSAQDSATDAENAKNYIENMNMEGNTLPAGSQVTVTKTQDSQGNLLFVIGVPQGPQGEQGVQGEQGIQGPQGVSVTGATVNEDGDLVITLSAGEPINAGSVIGPQGVQGETGPTGASVDRIERTSGTGAPGTTDTYTVYLTDGKTGGTFQVYNGSNGTGSGDFMADGSVPMTGDLQMGGHKITNLAEPTDNTDAASKEYVDDTITVSLVGNYIPTGQKGQANGVASLDNSGKVPNEQLPPMDYVPTSRTVNGHALSADVTLDADDVGAIPNPSGGTTGQVLTKTSTGEEWSDAPSGLPEGGTEGQMLYQGANGPEWGDKPVMYVNITKSGETYSADKTAQEIYEAYQNGYAVFAVPWDSNIPILLLSYTYKGNAADDYVANFLVSNFSKVYQVLIQDIANLVIFASERRSANDISFTPTSTLTSKNVQDAIEEVDTQLSTKLTTPTGTQGQYLGFTADNTVGAVDAPETGLTQEQADERYLQLSGGTLTGALTLNGEPTEDLQAAPKQYVDALKPLARTITLTASGWSSNTQTVTVPGVSASETAQLITPVPKNTAQSAYYEAGIMCTNQGTNSLTFTCQTVPTSNLTVYVVIQPLS